MKAIKILMTIVLGATAMSALAQDFSDPRYAKWGETPEQRKENILASSYLKEEVDNHNFNSAAAFLQQLIVNCPAASENIYANGVKLYKQKINRAETLAEKRTYVDSLLWLYDVRLQHFASHPKRGKAYLLERKAREYLTYKDSDREGVAEAFETAIAAQVEQNGVADPEVVAIYFKNICDDYSNDIVDAMTVVNIYDANAKFFENIAPEKEEFKKQFESCFATSGAASCENIETIFSKKLENNWSDEATLTQAYGLLARASCDNDFFITVAEKFYAVKPSSNVAMHLAQIFQNKKNFDKANQYLREALVAETNVLEREKLYVRIGILDMSINNFAEAIEAFNEARNLNPENAYVPYFLAQCYVSGAKGCDSFAQNAVYWVAYDLLMKSAPMLEALPDGEGVDTAANARKLAATYRTVFPTLEECFFRELREGGSYVVNCGFVRGVTTEVRPRQ